MPTDIGGCTPLRAMNADNAQPALFELVFCLYTLECTPARYSLYIATRGASNRVIISGYCCARARSKGGVKAIVIMPASRAALMGLFYTLQFTVGLHSMVSVALGGAQADGKNPPARLFGSALAR
jgi:hypothetical protein